MSRDAFMAAYGSEKHLDQLFGAHHAAYLHPESTDTVGELQETALNNPSLQRRHLETALTSPLHEVRGRALEHPLATEQDLIRGMSDKVSWIRETALRTHARRKMAADVAERNKLFK